MEYFISALKKYADFNGRARRKEYWMFILFYFLLTIVIAILDIALGTTIFSVIFALLLLIPSISVAARRLHDTNRTGWWQLIAIVPLIGLFILIYFLIQDSRKANNYGENPKLTPNQSLA